MELRISASLSATAIRDPPLISPTITNSPLSPLNPLSPLSKISEMSSSTQTSAGAAVIGNVNPTAVYWKREDMYDIDEVMEMANSTQRRVRILLENSLLLRTRLATNQV